MSTPAIGNPLAKIGDVIRGSVIAERPEQIRPLCEFITEFVTANGGKFYIKNFWADPKPLSLGYVGVHIKIRMPIPPKTPNASRHILMEVQLHDKDIMNGTKFCPKETAHRLYKTPRTTDEQTIPPHIISSSQLIYLIAMKKLLATREDEAEMKHNISLVMAMEKIDPSKILALETIFRREKLAVVWNEELQVWVPKDSKAVATQWMEKAREINERINLPNVRMDESVDWTNTATTVPEILDDANAIDSFFRDLCEQAAASQSGCSATFGPRDESTQTDCIIKKRGSLLAKMEADHEEEVGQFMLALLRKIGKPWAQITESRVAPFGRFSQLPLLNFSDCPQMTDDDLRCLESFSALQTLSLRGCTQVTNASLAYVERLTGLQFFDLTDCSRITNEGLRHLGRLTGLQTFHRHGTQITDEYFNRWFRCLHLPRQDVRPDVNQSAPPESKVAADNPQPVEHPDRAHQDVRPDVKQPEPPERKVAPDNPQLAEDSGVTCYECLIKTKRSLVNGFSAAFINGLIIATGLSIRELFGIEENRTKYTILAISVLSPPFCTAKKFPEGVLGLPAVVMNFWAIYIFYRENAGFMLWNWREKSIDTPETAQADTAEISGKILGMAIVLVPVYLTARAVFNRLGTTAEDRQINIPTGMCLGAATAALWGGDFNTTLAIMAIASGIFSCLVTIMGK